MRVFLGWIGAPFRWIWIALNDVAGILSTLFFAGLMAFVCLLFGKRIPYVHEENFPDIERWPQWLMICGKRLLPVHVIVAMLFISSYLWPQELVIALRWTGAIVAGYFLLIMPVAYYNTWLQRQRWYALYEDYIFTSR